MADLRLITKQASILMALLSIVLLFFIASQNFFLIYSLFRPLGLSLLQRLCDALRFLLVTTTITLGILNSNRLSSSSSSGKKRSPNYSMKEAADQSGSSWKQAAEIFPVADDPNLLSMADSSEQESEKSKDETVIRSPDVLEELVKGDLNTHTVKGLIQKEHGIRDQGRAPSIPKPAHEQAAAASVGAPNKKHRHRRSSSLTEAINEDKQLQGGHYHGVDVNAVACNKSIAAAAAIPQHDTITAAPALIVHKIDHHAETTADERKTVVSVTGLAASKHSRSRSAFNLNQMMISDGTNTEDDSHMNARKPRKVVVTSTDIAGRRRRRTASLSCDFETNYIDRSLWLCDVPSPPKPPMSEIQDHGLSASGASSSSSPSANYCDSLVPWRAPSAAIAVPKTTSTADPRMAMSPMPELQEESSRASSPSSPFLNARLTKKADDFIARFHERMRLQRLESLERHSRLSCGSSSTTNSSDSNTNTNV